MGILTLPQLLKPRRQNVCSVDVTVLFSWFTWKEWRLCCLFCRYLRATPFTKHFERLMSHLLSFPEHLPELYLRNCEATSQSLCFQNPPLLLGYKCFTHKLPERNSALSRHWSALIACQPQPVVCQASTTVATDDGDDFVFLLSPAGKTNSKCESSVLENLFDFAFWTTFELI